MASKYCYLHATGYAKFGKISEPVQGAGASAEALADGVQASISTSSDGLKPTRRVREPPGGAHSNIFGGCDDEDDALARAPPKPQGQYDEPVRAQPQPQEEEEPQGLALPSTMKPSRYGGLLLTCSVAECLPP